jgi:hypothetical protein
MRATVAEVNAGSPIHCVVTRITEQPIIAVTAVQDVVADLAE